MATEQRSDYSLLTYYCPLSVSNETHDRLRKLPAFITNDPTEHCHYYVQPNVFTHKTPSATIKNRKKYQSRSQRMLNMTKQANSEETHKQDIMRHTTVMRILQETNPNIKTIHEAKLNNSIKHMIDYRADDILSKRKNRKKDEISYFLYDTYGIYEADEGYHIQTIEQFHFGGDYGPDYQGTLFVDPEAYKMKQMKKKKRNNNNTNKVVPKRVEKVCHGCRQKYFEDEWDVHILCDAHQKYLRDPAFAEFTKYINELNKSLKLEDEEKEKEIQQKAAQQKEIQQKEIQQKEDEMNTNNQLAVIKEETIVLRRSERVRKRKYSAVVNTISHTNVKKRKYSIDLGCVISEEKLLFTSWPDLNIINDDTDFDNDGLRFANIFGSSLEMLPIENNTKVVNEKDEYDSYENKKKCKYAERMRKSSRKRRRRHSSLIELNVIDVSCCRRSDMRTHSVCLREHHKLTKQVYYQCKKCGEVYETLCA